MWNPGGLIHLQQLSDDGLDVVADVACHGERGAVADGKRDVQAAGDRLWQHIDKIEILSN